MTTEQTIPLQTTATGWWQRMWHFAFPPKGSLADATTRVVLASYALMALPYLVLFSASMFMWVAVTSFIGVMLWAFYLGRLGHKQIPRAVVTFFCPISIYLLTCMLYPSGYGEVGVSARMLLLAQAVAPFLIYRIEHLSQILFTLIFNAVLLTSVDYGVDIFPYKVEGIVLNTAVMRMVASLESMLFLAVVFWTYKKSSHAKEREIRLLVDAFTENAIAVSQANEALKASEKKLAEINETKNKFFGIIAHDLRTPLNSFEGFSNLLTNHVHELSPDEIQEMTISLQRSFNQVKALLENLLSWSRSQMNLLECKPEPVDLEVFIQGHASIYRQTAINKNITLQVEVEKGLLAMTDYNILSAVLRNLITNALKYSHPNATVFIETRSDGVDKVCVCVRDTGVGMSAQTLQNLFKIEYKSSVPGTMNEKGTGLGLILIRDFLRLLASDLNVESEEGQGSAFSFNLNRTWAEDDSTVGEKRLVLEAV